MVGIALSCYTVAALTIRPFSGYLLDTLARKPLYLISFFIFTTIFAGYLFAGSLTLFIILRIVPWLCVRYGHRIGQYRGNRHHALIAARRRNRILRPDEQHGDGDRPMVGLFLHDFYSFPVIFLSALTSCSLGWIMASLVRTPPKEPVKRAPVSLDRFILIKGIPAGIDLLLLSIPYGMTTTYVAMYAKEMGIQKGTGIFFTLMAAGMAISRIFSGRQVDKGRITQVIALGMYLACGCFFVLSACETLMSWNPVLTPYIFFGIALFLGIGFGTMFPAFNTLFVNLAPHNQRGTATSTYLTSWDVGIGAGLLLGGYLGEITTLDRAYLFGACLTVVSAIYFRIKVGPHFEKNKLR